jgi:hypothetical protein
MSKSTTAKIRHIHFIPSVKDVMSSGHRMLCEDVREQPTNAVERFKEEFVTIDSIRTTYQFFWPESLAILCDNRHAGV